MTISWFYDCVRCGTKFNLLDKPGSLICGKCAKTPKKKKPVRQKRSKKILTLKKHRK